MATTTHAPAPIDRQTAAPSWRRRVLDRLGVWAFRLAVLGLVGLNLWWFVREQRPVLDLKALRGLVDSRQYAEAETDLRERLRRSPHDDEARMLLARALAGQKRMLECAQELHRVPFWSPRKPEARFLEGQAFLEVGRARDAEPALRASVEDDPLHPTPDTFHEAATDLLIELYATERRWDDAQEVIWKTYERANTEDRAAALVMLLRTEVERIAPESVVERLRRYIAVDPEDFEARRALAKVEQALGHEPEATAQIQACLAARPDDLKAWSDWLTILQDRGDVSVLAEAVARLPRPKSGDYDAETWEAIGRVREATGDVRGAAEAYRKAVQGKPHEQDYHYRLALVEARLGNRDAGRDHLDRSKVLRQARSDLVDAIIAYREALATGRAADPRVVEAAGKVAELCRTIGMTKVADALAATHSRSP